MNAKSTPESILHDIAQIQRMDRGTICVIRQGPQGAYYNHQCYENGRNVSRYLPGDRWPRSRRPSRATSASAIWSISTLNSWSKRPGPKDGLA